MTFLHFYHLALYQILILGPLEGLEKFTGGGWAVSFQCKPKSKCLDFQAFVFGLSWTWIGLSDLDFCLTITKFNRQLDLATIWLSDSLSKILYFTLLGPKFYKFGLELPIKSVHFKFACRPNTQISKC